MDRPVTILAKNNGPFLVDGPFRLVDAEGNEYDVPLGKKVNLCRCGGSTRKPFCDGMHSKIGFDAAERAVRAMDEAAQASGGPTPGGAAPGGSTAAGGAAPGGVM